MVFRELEEVYAVWQLVFFCQAEDGIRGLIVTGVQTCALPILTPLMGGVVQTSNVDAGSTPNSVLESTTPVCGPQLGLALA